MFSLRQPSEKDVRKFISSQQDLPFSYSPVGATQNQPPPGYTVDHNRTKLGEGEEPYQRAVSALKDWGQFDLGWATVGPPPKRLEAGATQAGGGRGLAFVAARRA